MQDAVALFAIRLLCGTGMMLCLMPRRDVTSAFFRIMLLFQLGLGVLFGLAAAGSKWPAVVLCGIAFCGSVAWLLERRRAGTISLALVLGISLAELGLLVGGGRAPSSELLGKDWLALCSSLTSAATLGAALTGMLLGHRYLTAPGMPLLPLARLNLYLSVAAVLRLVVSAWALALGLEAISNVTYSTWLALRWLAGIAGPLAATWMVARILRYKNTQAATGVLFVAVILTFIGELTADLLDRVTGIPF